MSTTEGTMDRMISGCPAAIASKRANHDLNDRMVRVTRNGAAQPRYKMGAALTLGGIGRVWAVVDGRALVQFTAGSREDQCVVPVDALEVL